LTFSLGDLQYNYPDEPTESGLGPQAELERLAREGAARRFPAGVPSSVIKRIQEELALIERLNYARYFLTVHDIIKFARGQGILCQGRGSAANSIICFCIGITEVGPDKIDTLFERFISEERNEPPDIDVDFEHERREEVMQY
ncbi:MAG: error-prone DNA polymerase, partial [Mesorhizobium sp.]